MNAPYFEESCPSGGTHEPVLDYREGLVVCKKCGLVLMEGLPDLGKEWRSYNSEDEEARARAGGRNTSKVHDHGLHTEIGFSRSKRILSIKLQKMNRKLRVSPSERKLVTYLSRMNEEASKLGLPESVKETAGQIIRILVSKKLVNRIRPDYIIIATIYYAAQIQKITMTPGELVKRYNLDKTKFWEALSRVQVAFKELGLRPNVRPSMYVPQIVRKLGLSNKVLTKASELVNVLEQSGMTSGKSYVSLSAASIYLVATLFDEKRTQKDVASAINLTEVSIRNRYKEIIENFDIIVKL